MKNKKVFFENRTSWKWFEKRFLDNNWDKDKDVLLQIEILKELQFMNGNN